MTNVIPELKMHENIFFLGGVHVIACRCARWFSGYHALPDSDNLGFEYQ